MSESTSVSCALCGSLSELFCTPNFDTYRALKCSVCGEFVVSISATEKIAGLSVEIKERWRRLIRSAKPEEILLIIVEPIGSGGGLKAELVQRSTVRL